MTPLRDSAILRRMDPQVAIFIAFEAYAVCAALVLFAVLRDWPGRRAS